MTDLKNVKLKYTDIEIHSVTFCDLAVPHLVGLSYSLQGNPTAQCPIQAQSNRTVRVTLALNVLIPFSVSLHLLSLEHTCI